MKPTVISKEYLALQTEISNKQTEWAKQLEIEKQSLQHKQVPIIAQVNVKVDIEKYQNWILELASILVKNNQDLASEVAKLEKLFNDDTLKRWSEEALAFNEYYFQSFAEENEVVEWLPYFLAEHGIRPLLHAISEKYVDDLANMDTEGSCPCCGEPVRLAVLEGKGKKMVVCPRCEAKWNQRRLHCSTCGNEDHEKLSYYTVENDKSSKIEVCTSCNSYIKVIDTRKLFKKQTAFLLDVTSIHLDFVAQENGFGATEEKVNSN